MIVSHQPGLRGLRLHRQAFAQSDKELRLTREGRRLEAHLTGTQMAHLGATFAAAGRGAETGWRAVMRRMLQAR